jgi:hypothetical protein
MPHPLTLDAVPIAGQQLTADHLGCHTNAPPSPYPTQCVANHINPFPFLPGFEDRPAPKCPHCEQTIDATLMAREKEERESKSISGLLVHMRNHMRGHAQGLQGKIPCMPTDNRNRSRGLLHRRMNVASNCMAATFLRVPFSESKHIAANKLMDKFLIWKMPETSKKRAKTISAGNDARELFSNADLLDGLFEIFYPEDYAAATAEIADLRATAAANNAVRKDDAGAALKPRRAPAKSPPSRANPNPTQATGVAKKKPARGSKKAVVPVLSIGSKKVSKKDAKGYAEKRRGASSKSAPQPPAPTTATPAANPAGAAFTKAVAEAATVAPDIEDQEEDNSLAPDEEDEDGLMEDDGLEEDESTGFGTAVEVWLSAMRYIGDLHTPVDDHFNLTAREAHADKCAGSGKVWALAINEHTSNRALWQYVHDAFAHVREDIMQHGSGDRNDDAILEKGNRRFKRIGDRCVFRGGRNGGSWQRTMRVAERIDGKKTGRYISKKVTVKSVLGQAAQTQKLELVAQICEAKRAGANDKLSAKQQETKVEAKVLREVNRNAAVERCEKRKAEIARVG